MSAPAETDLIREALSHLPAAAWATTEAAHGQLDALVSELAALRVELQARTTNGMRCGVGLTQRCSNWSPPRPRFKTQG